MLKTLIERRPWLHCSFCCYLAAVCIGNGSAPKIIINDTTNLFVKTVVGILLISNNNSCRVMFAKLLPYILFENYINILELEMTNPGNGHTFVPYCKWSDGCYALINRT